MELLNIDRSVLQLVVKRKFLFVFTLKFSDPNSFNYGTKHLYKVQKNLVSRNTRGPSNAFTVSGVRLTNIICIEKALKGTEIVFVFTVFVLTRFYCICI